LGFIRMSVAGIHSSTDIYSQRMTASPRSDEMKNIPAQIPNTITKPYDEESDVFYLRVIYLNSNILFR